MAMCLPWLHRVALALATGRLPQAVSGAFPGHTGAHPGIYLRCVDWAHSHSLWPGALPSRTWRTPGIYASYMTGRTPVLHCCLPAVCHEWLGALPPQAHATTPRSPKLGALPGLRWQRERLQCKRSLASVYVICQACLAQWSLLVSSQNKENTFVFVHCQP